VDDNQLDLSEEELNNGEIEKVFNTIFVEETKENLKFLRDALESINSDSTPGEAVMRIKEACSSLKDSAASFNIVDVRDMFEKLHKITDKHLNFNRAPTSEVLDIIQDATDLLSKYIENQNLNLDPMNQKLRYFMTNSETISEKVEPDLKDREEEINVIDELQTFPKPKKKKKVKVKFNDDDENVRWISKFK
jgi:chemotaxis protein histidine kinase CheA